MSGRIKMMIIVMATLILLSSVFFILLVKFYPPLRISLFGGEIPISYDDIQFWIKKVPGGRYCRVYTKYLMSPKTAAGEWLDFSHPVFYADSKIVLGFNAIFFNPEDNKIYGGGSEENIKEWKWAFYCLGEKKVEKGMFKPIFPEGTKFTFHQLGFLEITSAPRNHIKIYFQGILKKLEKEELEKGILAEIAKNEDPARK